MASLLDTPALIWWLCDDPALSKPARQVISETSNVIFVSAVSAWEIATKVRIGKLPQGQQLASDFMAYMDREGFEVMPISGDHAIRAGLLPGPHKDPFDRMLIAQAQAENMQIVSNESLFDTYGVRRIW